MSDVPAPPADAAEMAEMAETPQQQQHTTPKERHSLTLDQRRALRRWAHGQTTRPSHKACIEWFYSQYGQNRRHGSAPNPAEDIPYLIDAVPRFMTISAETSPAAIRDAVLRVVGVEASLSTCARVRDEVVRRLEHPNPSPHPATAAAMNGVVGAVGPPGPLPPHPQGPAGPEPDAFAAENEDPEVVLQNALRQMQQEEADAEAEAAAVREQRERQEAGLPPIAPGLSTPSAPNGGAVRNSARFTPAGGPPEDPALTLTPISSGATLSSADRPLRCPFCVNQRMLRTIKEAVEHLSTHVVV
ncbi:hypothetical protein GGR56DRAFT_176673 [Xylariaceae sp. FL0804]|nr:hypothetical protein GGR56DRAFT_176673 [Xylariaceae sp. FL0804]